MSEWISVEDDKPHYYLLVLVYILYAHPAVNNGNINIAYRLGNAWYLQHRGEEVKTMYGIVTHWMPLPEPPKVEES